MSSRNAPLNIPAGNSQTSPDSTPQAKEDRLTGDAWRDYGTAIKRIDMANDIRNMGQIPCVRTSLLYGISGGVGIGAIRFFGTRKPLVASNWAILSFVTIALVEWQTCRTARAKELHQMRLIQEKFPHRHISRLQQSDASESAADVRT